MKERSHSQRKGQWLFNEINKSHNLVTGKLVLTVSGKKPIHQDIVYGNLHQILFYMTNDEFDKIMEKYND